MPGFGLETGNESEAGQRLWFPKAYFLRESKIIQSVLHNYVECYRAFLVCCEVA